MPYAFMSLRPQKNGHGFGPDFPEGFGFMLLADCHGPDWLELGVDWALYEYTPDDEHWDWEPETPLSNEHSSLINSRWSYPPAMALAKNDVKKLYRGKQPTKEEFAAAFAASMRSHLANQNQSGFQLVEVVRTTLYYKYQGQWYWVLAISKSEPHTVIWVSDNFYVYQDAAADFNLTSEQRNRLPKKRTGTLEKRCQRNYWHPFMKRNRT